MFITGTPFTAVSLISYRGYLYLLQRGNASVLVFFHNPAGEPSSDGQNLMGGSYLAAVGNIIVVTVNFRVGAFGFFSTGKPHYQ